MKIRRPNNVWLTIAVGALAIITQTGCMTVQRGSPVVQNTNTQQYAGKTIAALPVKTLAGIATDSILPLRQEINKSLGQVARGRLPSSTVLDVGAVASKLNQTNQLSVYEQIVATYENTGVMDRKLVETLGRGLGSDYLLFTRLKAEKMDLVISKGFGASIDAMLVDAHTGEVTWSGTGEWKRGGVYGFGETKLDEAAGRLLELTFSSLVGGGVAAAPTTRAPAAPPAAKEAAIAAAPAKAESSSQKLTVQQVQQRLAELGYRPGPADGKLGKGTVAALRKFQQDNNLAKTGQADNETVAKLLRSEGVKASSSSTQRSVAAPVKGAAASDL